ncbi:TPA: hypothetical protein N2F56_003294 [Salmonella enterica]|nr:hypothetical protein [Salmonella enterica]HAU3224032.1 hypothetical protein [Salmonella enterica subsp. houtenae]QKT19864.1 hypothetical protein HPG84_20065 [Salmonella enterica]HCL4435573.1 hypothetical protein [Salmonella enterica]HCL5082834.1 hypothetical protein [Salmonella enterica]
MKKIVSVCALLIAACPLSSWAEWTEDSSINYYSDEVISEVLKEQVRCFYATG